MKQMNEEYEGVAGDQDDDAIHLNAHGSYGANRVASPMKKSKTVEEDGKLLTSRKPHGMMEADASNPASIHASMMKNRSIRNPDFIRQSMLSSRQSSLLVDQQ